MTAQLHALRELVRDPLNNLVATTLALAIVVLFVLIAVLIALLWVILRYGSQGRKRRPPAHPAARRSPMAGLIAFAAFVTAIISGYVLTSSNTYCASTCHAMADPGSSWSGSTHRRVSCVRCHEGRMLLSVPSGTLSRIRDAYYEFRRVKSSGIGLSESRCLECHSGIAESTVRTQRGVLMAHEHVLRAGMTCSACHRSVGHEPADPVPMSKCLPCHDGSKAPSDCDTCHTGTPDEAIPVKGEMALAGTLVELPDKPTCGGCHDQEKCDACHGLRMPHPAGFSNPGLHAAPAAFGRKAKVCARCHVPNECFECHLPFDSHTDLWDEEHKTYPRDALWCRGCHTGVENMCDLCHDF